MASNEILLKISQFKKKIHLIFELGQLVAASLPIGILEAK